MLATMTDPMIDRTALLAPEAPLWSRLDDQGLIRASGPDAADFLQNLLTNDVQSIALNEIRLAGFCTPKGRLLALFRVVRDPSANGDLLLILPREVLPGMLKKLSMYVLRAKVKLTDASAEFALIGIATAVSPAPTCGNLSPFRLNSTDRPALWMILAPAAQATTDLADLNPEREVAIETWHWLTIAAGLPHVELATQEAFVPQMLNMELLAVAGISFSKGCYPGQEIVARTQYLGKIKRRMVRVRLSASAKPGDQVFAPESGDQPCGALVFVARSPESTGDIEALLCAQIAAIEAGSITVGAPVGPPLTLLDLPYALDGPDTRKR